MTDEEWLGQLTTDDWSATDEWEQLLVFCDGKPRKLRLLACAACRIGWSEMDADTQSCVSTAEDYADGTQTLEQLEFAQRRLPSAVIIRRRIVGSSTPIGSAVRCATRGWLSTGDGVPDAIRAVQAATATPPRVFADLLRDIFGNPFRPVAFDPAWRSEAAVGIARGIYDDRAFERMPILADALQEAGCEHPDILTHCREPGTHVRGCWVVDLVLGKE